MTLQMDKPLGPPIRDPYIPDVRWAFWKWADIESAYFPGYTYLRRLRIFQTPLFAFYLHWIYEPDDTVPHDHPCNFWSMIIRGGYEETVFRTQQLRLRNFLGHVKRWRRGSIHRMPVSMAHYISDLTPGTITLVLFGRRRKGWGFWTSDGFVPSKQYVAPNGARKGTGVVQDPFCG